MYDDRGVLDGPFHKGLIRAARIDDQTHTWLVDGRKRIVPMEVNAPDDGRLITHLIRAREENAFLAFKGNRDSAHSDVELIIFEISNEIAPCRRDQAQPNAQRLGKCVGHVNIDTLVALRSWVTKGEWLVIASGPDSEFSPFQDTIECGAIRGWLVIPGKRAEREQTNERRDEVALASRRAMVDPLSEMTAILSMFTLHVWAMPDRRTRILASKLVGGHRLVVTAQD